MLIGAEAGVAGEERRFFGEGLRDEKAVERVAVIVVKGQMGEPFEMSEPNGKEFGAHFTDGGVDIGNGEAQFGLQDDFPAGYDADNGGGVASREQTPGGAGNGHVAGVAEKGVGVEEKSQVGFAELLGVCFEQ